MRTYCVYILASASRRLYIGSTSNLVQRLAEHRAGYRSRYAARYRITKLVHYEATYDVASAISRERQLKGWLRARKVALIDRYNSDWRDLAADWPEFRVRPMAPQRHKPDPSLRSG